MGKKFFLPGVNNGIDLRKLWDIPFGKAPMLSSGERKNQEECNAKISLVF